ncbi:DUF2977 domain-containing protein [Pediococcus pentosaceus]|uniref:DUF2977 domain-containing protein n=1 Tax=Pediococcus pentosaceus TaxID=1255 RepID=UPI002B4BDD8E|nr:DUF2977 domain-containing protein [Pediococcus pentosaceus]MEB3377166.1 DUF2977 domain-containing protein [Pediococcus pentosaceus]
MQLVINDKNEITAYASVGDIGGTEYSGEIPENFYSDFKPEFFLFKDGKIYENPNYVKPVTNLPTGPTSLEQIVMQQAMTITQMQQMLMQQSKDIATLKGVNK